MPNNTRSSYQDSILVSALLTMQHVLSASLARVDHALGEALDRLAGTSWSSNRAYARGRRTRIYPYQHKPITTALDVYQRLRHRFDGEMQEIFVVLALNANHKVIDIIEVARGCVTHVEVHPREVFRPLIRQAAVAAIVAHNHPSGDPTPSAQDRTLTKRLRLVAKVVGIPILDHLIIGRGAYWSFICDSQRRVAK